MTQKQKKKFLAC